jgi:S1-C subfamily serine protease
MRTTTWCCIAAAILALGLVQAGAQETKKEGKPATKTDEEANGKIAESQKKLLARQVRSEVTKINSGVYILDVTAGGPAMSGREKPKGGGDVIMLEEGDIITHINGKEVKTAADYHKLMSGNDEKKLTVIDVNSDKPIIDYFKPQDGRLMIKFEIISPPLG